MTVDLRDALNKFGRELREADAALAEVGIYPGEPFRPLADRIRELAAREPAPEPVPLDVDTDLYDISLTVTVRAYSRPDAEHLGRMYQSRVQSLGVGWPVTVDSVEPSKRDAI